MTYKNLLTIELLATAALGKIVSEGLWTGHDWYDDEHNIGVKDGEPYSNDPEADRMINTPKSIDGEVEDYKEKENVKRVVKFLDEDNWEYFFPFRNEIYTYESFLKAVAKFPAFCGENNREPDYDDDDMCAREIATVFAHFVQETSYNSAWEESANGIHLWRQGLYYLNELACGPGEVGYGTASCDYYWLGWAGEAWPVQEGAQYHGRGPFQLSYNFNYGQFSNIFVESKYDSKMHFLEHPELVGENGDIAFASALWFYMVPQSPKPSMHDVTTGFWQPNEADEAAGIKGNFGSTINVINGGVECGGGPNTKAENRGKYYLEFQEAFNLPIDDVDLDCATEGSFPDDGAGAYPGYYEYRDWINENACVLVTWQTPYTVYARDDYKRCICDSIGNGEESCPQADPEEEDEDEKEEEEDEEEEEEKEEEEEEEDEEDEEDDEEEEEKEQDKEEEDEEGESSITNYQVDRALYYIEQKLIEFHAIMQENELL